MTAPTAQRPAVGQTLDPEHPDFFDHCFDFATRVICPGNGRCQDPYFQASAIEMLASAICFVVLDGHEVRRSVSEIEHPCACGGGAEASKRRRNPKAKPGGRIP